MRELHLSHGMALDAMVALAPNMAAAAAACKTWRALYNGLQQFHDDLTHPMHLENKLLFPQLGAAARCRSAGRTDLTPSQNAPAA